jgi:two-component system sensor histidine kinase MprB
LATALVIAIVAGVLVAIGLAFAAAHRALQPARRMAQTAAAIRSGDLSERISYEGPMDELGKLAAELDACFAELEAAMERQRRFVADASHQLKTPIAAMRANAEFLKGWARTTPAARHAALDSLETASRGAGRVVGDLLYLADLERQPRRASAAVRLDQVLVNALREAQALRTAIPIRIERIDEAEVHGDELRLQQLLVNVLDNALRVSPAGEEVKTTLEASNGTVSVTIADRGPGIELERMERIFERFYSGGHDGGANESGAGLGLPIARSIAREHGGDLTAGNRDGGGAVFRLELPALRSSSN